MLSRLVKLRMIRFYFSSIVLSPDVIRLLEVISSSHCVKLPPLPTNTLPTRASLPFPEARRIIVETQGHGILDLLSVNQLGLVDPCSGPRNCHLRLNIPLVFESHEGRSSNNRFRSGDDRSGSVSIPPTTGDQPVLSQFCC